MHETTVSRIGTTCEMRRENFEMRNERTVCLRATGEPRAVFDSIDEALQMIANDRRYRHDVVVLCGLCSRFHCSHPSWLEDRPWETPVSKARPS